LIRKMWDLMLTGNYTPPRILEIANNEWGFRTKKYKRVGGRPLSRSGIYAIFTNLFYAGIIVNKGIQYEGKHDRMITLEEYDRVQVLLGRKGNRDQNSTNLLSQVVCGAVFAVVCIPPKPKRKSLKRLAK